MNQDILSHLVTFGDIDLWFVVDRQHINFSKENKNFI